MKNIFFALLIKIAIISVVFLVFNVKQEDSKLVETKYTKYTEKKPLHIGIMPKVINSEYSKALEQGVKEAANELELDVAFDGPQINSVTQQIEILNDWISKKYDVIAVAPNDPDEIAPTLKRARMNGIHLITWDADANAGASGREYFVNQASYESVGVFLVDIMAEQAGEDAKTAIITGSLSAANQNIWIDWMRKHISSNYPNMQIVAVKTGEESQQSAFQYTQNLLKAIPDLKGIFALSSLNLPGVAEAVRQMGLTGKVVVTGISHPASMKQYIEDAVIKTFVFWNPIDLGYLTVYTAKILIENSFLSPSKLKAGRLGDIEVKGDEVILGPPLKITSENINKFNF